MEVLHHISTIFDVDIPSHRPETEAIDSRSLQPFLPSERLVKPAMSEKKRLTWRAKSEGYFWEDKNGASAEMMSIKKWLYIYIYMYIIYILYIYICIIYSYDCYDNEIFGGYYFQNLRVLSKAPVNHSCHHQTEMFFFAGVPLNQYNNKGIVPN